MLDLFKDVLDEKVISVNTLSGGDINEAYKITTKHNVYFAKTNDIKHAFLMLEAEASALVFMSKTEGVRVPEVKFLTQHRDTAVLILEWIHEGNKRKLFNHDFAEMLNKLHRTGNDLFGLEFDNYIGSLDQSNARNSSWLDFYYQERIMPQVKMAVDDRKIEPFYLKRVDSMFKNLSMEFLDVSPSLLHGDLWSGNYMTDQEGKPVLIDPAIYFGHREVDFAMMKLFGGFHDEIFSIYNELSPFDHEWENRIKFYQLYYVLVHVNLFGLSYSDQAKSIIDSYR